MCSLIPNSFHNGVLLLFFITNVRYGHFMYMVCYTFLVVWHHIELMNISSFIYSSQNILMFNYCCWRILMIIFWNHWMYHICTSLVEIIFLNGVTLTSFVFGETHPFTSLSNPVYIYICWYYIWSSTTLYKWLFWSQFLFCKRKIRFFPCSHVRTTD